MKLRQAAEVRDCMQEAGLYLVLFHLIEFAGLKLEQRIRGLAAPLSTRSFRLDLQCTQVDHCWAWQTMSSFSATTVEWYRLKLPHLPTLHQRCLQWPLHLFCASSDNNRLMMSTNCLGKRRFHFRIFHHRSTQGYISIPYPSLVSHWQLKLIALVKGCEKLPCLQAQMESNS